MRVFIHKDYQSLSKWTACYIAKKINDFKPTSEKPFVLGLPTGSSPIGTYSELIDLVKQGLVSFQNVVTFNMDEYVGIPETHPQSYHYFMNKYLFNHIDIQRENIHFLNGNARNLDEECYKYEEKINEFGGIELFLGGIGSNGHIAFNEPCSSFESKTRLISLTDDTICANSRFFNNDVKKVPISALTVGILTVMHANEVILIVNGSNKAVALQKVLEESVNNLWPASVLQLHPKGLIVCDNEATLELNAETVKRFKDVEKID
jgi:glucosamine-6-phosphate deaminase